MTTLAVSEKRFSEAVVEAARLRGWRVYRTFDSRRSPACFPNLVLVLDAILPDRLLALVDNAIRGHVDPDAWQKEEAVEASERELVAEGVVSWLDAANPAERPAWVPIAAAAAAVAAQPRGRAVRNYKSTRVRGLASWKPHKKTRVLVEQMRDVLDEYADFLPITLRQVFYRLVATRDYPKDELAYDKLGEHLNRARRAGVIPFESIRDDGASVVAPPGFHGMPEFLSVVVAAADAYRRHRLEGQAVSVELWVEASGMVPQLVRVVDPFGVTVHTSAGGFDGTTMKQQAATRIVDRARLTIVLHVGDFDPSGLSIFDAAAEDVRKFVADMGSSDFPEFRRVAVTEEQIERYSLAVKPAKESDDRGGWTGGTAQAEALAPDELAAEVRRALERELDADVLERLLAVEAQERRKLVVEMFSSLGDGRVTLAYPSGAA